MPDVDPSTYRAVLGMEQYVRDSSLERSLRELVKIRASQLNGCAHCLDMHIRDARANGEDQRRLDVIAAWREAPELFSDRERAALALTEAVTLIADGGVADDVWAEAHRHFDDKGMAQLLMTIVTINVWNRLAVSTQQRLMEVS